jgi:hypothetical protein
MGASSLDKILHRPLVLLQLELENRETCRRLSVPLRDYLGSVLPGLANFPINRVAELTPSAWAARI